VEIAETVEAKRAGKFKQEKLQCLIAALMIRNDSKFSLSLIPAGSGKTFIIMLLTLYFAQRRNNSVLVLTSSGFLETQMDLELKPYLRGTDYKVCHFNAPH
jgi:hypothetical protein